MKNSRQKEKKIKWKAKNKMIGMWERKKNKEILMVRLTSKMKKTNKLGKGRMVQENNSYMMARMMWVFMVKEQTINNFNLTKTKEILRKSDNLNNSKDN